MVKTKVFAAYLPQYHEIEENNRFWGKGFTDWVGVKNARPQFVGHRQPRVPLDNNYYDLSQVENLRWQAKLAKDAGLAGFNIYHYWFKGGHRVLQKPAELFLENKDIDINFYFSWDNTSWIRSWSNIVGNPWAPLFDNGGQQTDTSSPYLLEMDYEDEEAWTNHYRYLSRFFKDNRYYKIDGKPVFAFMRAYQPETLQQMVACWDRLAKQDGLAGVYCLTQAKILHSPCILDAQFLYEPRFSVWGRREAVEDRLKKYIGLKLPQCGPVRFRYDYEKAWRSIIKNAKKYVNQAMFYSGLVAYDDTPRRGKRAGIIVNDNPYIYEKYLRELYKISCANNKEFMLLTAWNEWGEGAYLEPDTENGNAYLEATKRALTD